MLFPGPHAELVSFNEFLYEKEKNTTLFGWLKLIDSHN